MSARQGQFALKTDVPVSRTKVHLEQLVREKYGASRFGILEGDDQVELVFSIDEPPRTVRFLVQLPSVAPSDNAFKKLDRHGYARVQREVEQETRSTWRALLLLVKGKLEGVARGVVEFDEEFLAHIVTDNGATFFERFQAGELPFAQGPPMLTAGAPQEEAEDVIDVEEVSS